MADIDAEDKNETKVLFGKHNVWAIGITSVIGGHYFGWNSGLYSGFGSYLIATVLIALAYCCLCFCASEISSALPFAGGSYGLARCTLGYFPGFIVGCSETFQYIVFVSYSVLMMGDIIFEVAGLGTHNSYEPLLWLAFLLPVLVTHIIGGNIFWRFNYIIAIVSLVILMIFLFGQLDKVNYKNFKFLNKSGDDHYFVGGVLSFVKYFPVVSNFYLGVESINLASDDIKEPKVNVPFGQISCFFTLCACSILVVMVTCALPPGLHELAHSRYPLDKGEDIRRCCNGRDHLV
jgi:amino acid transporter